MKKRTIYFLLALILLGNTGCSKMQDYFRARMKLLRAEQIYWKTIKLQDKKVSFEERKPYYAQACRTFLEVLDLAPQLFTAGKIEEASNSCFNAENVGASRRLEEFNDAYCKNHPKECEYGFIESGGEF